MHQTLIKSVFSFASSSDVLLSPKVYHCWGGRGVVGSGKKEWKFAQRHGVIQTRVWGVGPSMNSSRRFFFLLLYPWLTYAFVELKKSKRKALQTTRLQRSWLQSLKRQEDNTVIWTTKNRSAAEYEMNALSLWRKRSPYSFHRIAFRVKLDTHNNLGLRKH